jgi:uncharacterized protein YjbI with pentapeptide repeats
VKGAKLGASFQDQDLHGRDLSGWDLCGADLRGADLTAAKLHGAELNGTDLRRAKFVDADFAGARIGLATSWPHCVRPPQGPVVPAGWAPAVCSPGRTK